MKSKITVESMKRAMETADRMAGQDVFIHWPGGFIRAPRQPKWMAYMKRKTVAKAS